MELFPGLCSCGERLLVCTYFILFSKSKMWNAWPLQRMTMINNHHLGSWWWHHLLSFHPGVLSPCPPLGTLMFEIKVFMADIEDGTTTVQSYPHLFRNPIMFNGVYLQEGESWDPNSRRKKGKIKRVLSYIAEPLDLTLLLEGRIQSR